MLISLEKCKDFQISSGIPSNEAKELCLSEGTGGITAEFDDVEVLQLDTTGLLAGTSERGAYEENITELLKELQDGGEQYVLMIDEIHVIVGNTSTGGSKKENDSQLNLANLLKPLLARGKLKCIGATTMDEYSKFFMNDKALMRRFQPIHLAEPDEHDTMQIMKHIHTT